MKESLFKKVDTFVFKQVELIKSHPQVTPLLAKIEQLPDAQQKIINQVSTLILGFSPLFLFLILFFQNVSLRSELDSNEELLAVINNIASKSNELSQVTRQLAGPQAYEDKTAFEQKLRGLLAGKGIDPTNLNIQNFESGQSTEEITSFTASLTFKRLSTAQMIDVIEGFMIQDKMKISSLEIIRNDENSTLAGTIGIQHIGKRGL